MAKAFPKWQQVLPLHGSKPGAKNVVVTDVEINDSTSTYFVLADGALDVKELLDTRTQTASTFYLSGTGDSVVNIDGGTVGDRRRFASLHDDLSFSEEK
jgi:hypothetical protein